MRVFGAALALIRPPQGGRAPRAWCAEAGSTLLEVLLAVTIVATGSAIVVANMPAPEPTLAREATVLAARLAAAADEAVISGQPIGLDVDAAGYGFRRRDAGAWRPIMDDPSLARRAWAAGVSASVVREGARLDRERLVDIGIDDKPSAFTESAAAAPVGRFDPTGSATQLRLDLRSEDGVWRITVGVDGAVSVGEAGES